MKLLKKIVIVILILFSIPFITALFVKKEYSVKREIVIKKPVEDVFNFVKYLKNQDVYSPWFKKDPNMKQSYVGTDGEVGFIYSWVSNHEDVGSGEQEIKGIENNKKIVYELRFKEPFNATEPAYFKFNSIDSSSTKIVWGFKGKMSYPSNLFIIIMDIENVIGNNLKNGLIDLKKHLENV